MYAELLAASGFTVRGPLVPAKALTTDPAQVESLFGAAEAPEALAMMSGFGTGVGLPHGDPDWSVSCLPNYSGHPGYRRAATFTIARDEVFYVWMELATGQVSDWGMLIDDSAERELAGEVHTSGAFNRTQHGLFMTGQGYEQFVERTRSEGVRAAAALAARAKRRAPATTRGNSAATALNQPGTRNTRTPATPNIPARLKTLRRAVSHLTRQFNRSDW